MADKKPGPGQVGPRSSSSLTADVTSITLGQSITYTATINQSGGNASSIRLIRVNPSTLIIASDANFDTSQTTWVNQYTPGQIGAIGVRVTTYSEGNFQNEDHNSNIVTVNVAAAPIITTDTDDIYIRATSTPATPTGGTTSENHTPSGWQQSQPNSTSTHGVYRARRTRTYSDGVFTSATIWGNVTLVDAADPVITTQTDYIYGLFESTPSTPTGGTTSQFYTPSGWQQSSQLSSTSTRNVYRARRTRYFTNNVFTSASVWRTVELRIASNPVYLGSTQIGRLYYGNIRVGKLYKGSTFVYEE